MDGSSSLPATPPPRSLSRNKRVGGSPKTAGIKGPDTSWNGKSPNSGRALPTVPLVIQKNTDPTKDRSQSSATSTQAGDNGRKTFGFGTLNLRNKTKPTNSRNSLRAPLGNSRSISKSQAGSTKPEKPVKPNKFKKAHTITSLEKKSITTKPIIPQKPQLPIKPTTKVPSTKPPKLPPKPIVLSAEEHVTICEACKKFCNANKQLLAVCRSTLEKVKGTDKGEFLSAQLGAGSEDLREFNSKFSDMIREASKALDHKKTNNIACLTVDLANFTSVICAGLKLAAVECSDDGVFRTCLKAITTVRDSLMLVVDNLKNVPEKVDTSIVPQLTDHVKKTSSTLAGLVGHRATGPLIPAGTRMEIEATIRATVVSIAKLVNSFNGPLEQSLLTEAKVASCCVAQMYATLTEMINTNTNLLSIPEIREIIVKYAANVKKQFAIFMERTKECVSSPTADNFEIMKNNESPLRVLFTQIVTYIQAYSIIDTSDRSEIVVSEITPTEEHKKVAMIIVADPEDIVPPAPANVTRSAIDVPDDFVKSTEDIWNEPEEDEGRILYTSEGSLRCATLNKLIIYTTANLDMTRMKTFITTYRSFTTPETLLAKIIQRYHVPESKSAEALPIQLRCCNSLKNLIELNPEDFSETFNTILEAFLMELDEVKTFKKIASAIRAAILNQGEDRQNTKTEIVNLTVEEKIPLCPAKLLFVIHEEEIARQLTLVDFRIYRAIKPVELLNTAWSKKKYRHRAKNVLTLVARSTQLTMWVASVILWQETLKGRIRAYTKIVNIAMHLFQLNNFNSLMAILAGLNTSAIYRLKFTRDLIPDSTKQELENLTDLMDPTQSYGNYRQKLHDVDPPCVPFLGTYLTDITFIEDGNPDYVQGLINYRKWELVFTVIREIQQYQQQSYAYDMANIAHFLTELPSNNEEHLYALSLIREPRGATVDQLL